MNKTENLKLSITKDEVMQLPLTKFKGKIHLIDNTDQISKAVKALSKAKVLGFDTETRPSFRKGQENKISLLQLSNDTDAYLFRLNKLSFNKDLLKLLEDSNIVKVGVAIRDDIKGLKKISSFTPKGFIELADITKMLKIKNTGLRNLAAIFLNIRISKGPKLSNWDANKLSTSQKEYAAMDAWLGQKILEKISIIDNKLVLNYLEEDR